MTPPRRSSSPRRSSPLPVSIGIVLALAGIVFALQGLGVQIGRSFMIGDLRWTAIGAGLIVVAALLVLRTNRRR